MSKPDIERLRACPFCGHRAIMSNSPNAGFWWISCTHCEAEMSYGTQEDVIAQWNARDAASEAEALRADAMRYLWMRDRSRPLNYLLENLYGDQLDAFVDAAIAASKPASAKGGES